MHGTTANLADVELVLSRSTKPVVWYVAATPADGSLALPDVPAAAVDLGAATPQAAQLLLLRVPGDDPLQRAQLLLGNRRIGLHLELDDATPGERVVISGRQNEN